MCQSQGSLSKRRALQSARRVHRNFRTGADFVEWGFVFPNNGESKGKKEAI